MASNSMKRWLIRKVIKENALLKPQWDTTNTPTEAAKIKKTDPTKCGKDVEELELSYGASGSIKMHNHFAKKSVSFLKRTHLLHDLATPLWGIYSRAKKAHVNTKTCMSALNSFICKSQRLEITPMSINGILLNNNNE